MLKNTTTAINMKTMLNMYLKGHSHYCVFRVRLRQTVAYLCIDTAHCGKRRPLRLVWISLYEHCFLSIISGLINQQTSFSHYRKDYLASHDVHIISLRPSLPSHGHIFKTRGFSLVPKVWPDLAKVRHFDWFFKSLAIFG